jgi:hypothetical protein
MPSASQKIRSTVGRDSAAIRSSGVCGASFKTTFEEIVVVVKPAVCFMSIAALLIAVMNVPDAQAQGRHQGRRTWAMGQGVVPLFVIRYDAVQKELALTQDQVAKVKDLVAEVHEEWAQQIQTAGAGSRKQQQLSSEERQQRIAEMRSKQAEIASNVNAKFRSKLAEILDKPQQSRLGEIAIQVAGSRAFQDAEVVQKLGLTKAEQDQLAAVHTEYSEKIAQLRSQRGQGDRAASFAKMNELRQEELAKSTEVLTKPQQETFATLKGKPFDVAQLHHSHRRHSDKTKGDKSA